MGFGSMRMQSAKLRDTSGNIAQHLPLSFIPSQSKKRFSRHMLSA